MSIIIIGILILIIFFYYYSEFNSKKIGLFNVHRVDGDVDSAKTFEEIDRRIKILKKQLYKRYGCNGCSVIGQFNMHERARQLDNNYRTSNLYEISPNNIMGNTSFTESKGKKIVMCLRNGDGAMHDINTIMFVALHEITHVMNDRWGHERQFWELFKIILQNAVECGIYKPIDYAKNPQSYCGITITQSPLYDF